jgi:hypothetical protein
MYRAGKSEMISMMAKEGWSAVKAFEKLSMGK